MSRGFKKKVFQKKFEKGVDNGAKVCYTIITVREEAEPPERYHRQEAERITEWQVGYIIGVRIPFVTKKKMIVKPWVRVPPQTPVIGQDVGKSVKPLQSHSLKKCGFSFF